MLRWYVLILTCLIYAINIADRYVVSTVLEPIRLELRLDDAGVAFLTGAPLALFYVTFGIPISWLADRANRRNILAISLVVWSGFTTLCGLSRNYWEFLLGRIGVGVGEAGGTPPSTAIVSDYFPPDRRPMAMTVLALGAPIGAFLGANFAGAVAHAYTWRAAFIALGIPGLVVGIIVYLTVREPARGRLDAIVDEIKPTLWESLRFLWVQKAAYHVVIGGGLCALWGWGLIYWTPTFLQRAYHLDVGQAGAVTGNIHLWGGSIATVATAWVLSPGHGGPPAMRLAAGCGYRFGDHSFDDRLLDPFAVGLQADVLDVHSRHLFLHRPVLRAAQQPRTLPHAQHVHCDQSAGRQHPESDRRALGRRILERLVRPRSCHGCGIAARRLAGIGPQRILGRLSLVSGVPHHHRGSEARHRLH